MQPSQVLHRTVFYLLSPFHGSSSMANEHMTSESRHLSDYTPSGTAMSVILVNGSLARFMVLASGKPQLKRNIELRFVLHIPGFPFDLLSMCKISKTFGCPVSFYLYICIFQDLKTWKMVMRHEVGGLYYLDFASAPLRALRTYLTPYQWHCCLGHPPLHILERNFVIPRWWRPIYWLPEVFII